MGAGRALSVVEAGQRWRLAAESGDFDRTLRTEWDLVTARMAERGLAPVATGYMSESLYDACRGFTGAAELGLPDQRLEDVTRVLSLAQTYTGFDITGGVRALLLGLRLPLAWDAFIDERQTLRELATTPLDGPEAPAGIDDGTLNGALEDLPRAGGLMDGEVPLAEYDYRPYIDEGSYRYPTDEPAAVWNAAPATWQAILVCKDDTSWCPAGLSDATLDARTVLASSGLIRHRRFVTRERLARSTMLPYGRLDNAVAELIARGYAAPATLDDRLNALTIARLHPILRELDLRASGRKAVLVQALIDAAVDPVVEERILQILEIEGAPPDGLMVGLGAGRDADWFDAYAALVAHWLTASVRRADADRADPGASYWVVERTKSCPFAHRAKRQVKRRRTDDLPPYCVGCTCDFRPIYAGVPAKARDATNRS